MRILQLIDSLRPGGAERMAVNYANALAKRIDGSHLCCTRMEGLLQSQLSSDVGYIFLNKKHTLDIKAFFKIRDYIKENRINLIQAHSSSWFLALLIKLSLPKVKLVWHDHYGRDLRQRKSGLLKGFSGYFDGIISVNENLKEWAVMNLNLSYNEVRYFRNFFPSRTIASSLSETICLLGEKKSFKIVCVANLRPQKNHINLLQAIKLLPDEVNCSLHLVGKDEENNYSAEVKKYIKENFLKNSVFLYGEQEKVMSLLKQADLGVLSSSSEGLPLALLEYGHAGLPVVCTRVGQCAEVVEDKGKVVPPENSEKLAEAMLYYLENETQRIKDSAGFQEKVVREFSEEAVVPEVIFFLRDVLTK